MADVQSPYAVNAVAARVIRSVERLLAGPESEVVAIHIGRATPPAQSTAAADAAPIRRVNTDRSWYAADAVDASRLQRYNDYRASMAETPSWSRALDVRKSYVFGGRYGIDGQPMAFDLKFSAGVDPDVRQICESTVERLNLHNFCPPAYRSGQGLGDCFSELVFDERSKLLTELRPWQPERIRARLDARSRRLVEWMCYVGAGEWSQTTQSGEIVACDPFFMAHYAPAREHGHVYGTSLFYAGMKNRRSGDAEADFLTMAVMESIAQQYLLWPFPREQSADKMWSFIRRVRESVELNMAFAKDGKLRRKLAQLVETSPRVMPYLIDPEMKEAPKPFTAPTAPIKDVLDVVRWREDVDNICHGVPPALCGLERNVNAKATLGEQNAAFAVAIVQDQTDFAQQVPSQVLLRACLAQGKVPKRGDVRIDMFPPSQLVELQRAQVAKAQGEACKEMVAAGIPLDYAMTQAFGMDRRDVVAIIGGAGGSEPVAKEAIDEIRARAIEAAESMARESNRPLHASVDLGAQATPAVPTSLDRRG
jgi:hypothetical protein